MPRSKAMANSSTRATSRTPASASPCKVWTFVLMVSLPSNLSPSYLMCVCLISSSHYHPQVTTVTTSWCSSARTYWKARAGLCRSSPFLKSSTRTLIRSGRIQYNYRFGCFVTSDQLIAPLTPQGVIPDDFFNIRWGVCRGRGTAALVSYLMAWLYHVLYSSIRLRCWLYRFYYFLYYLSPITHHQKYMIK